MTINQNIKFNKEKFKQVLHYIISKVGAQDNIGKTVLYKMMYFSDFDFYELNEKPLTGKIYVKLPQGPAPSDFNIIQKELVDEEKVQVVESKYCGFPQIKFLSISDPSTDLLNGNELQLIERVINKLANMTATQISGYSHEDMPWKATKDGKEIDYELVFYRTPAFSVSEEHGKVC